MIDKFKAFLTKKKEKELPPEFWENELKGILRKWCDPSFGEVWEKDGDYYKNARSKLVALREFKKECANHGDVLQALKLLAMFFEEEKRKAGLGKTTKKPPKTAPSSGGGEVAAQSKVEVLEEGAIQDMHVSKRERNSDLRRACIEHYMTRHKGCIACEACGMAFGKVYGEVGEGYIEVHHLSPISQTEGVHEVDPTTDLVPLCANCHAMIHRLMAADKQKTGKNLEGAAALEKLKNIIKGHNK